MKDGKFYFIMGYIDRPALDATRITAGDYPKGESPWLFKYEKTKSGIDERTVNDVAVVQLEKPLNESPLTLYGGQPEFDTFINTKEKLVFVGYGFNSIDGNGEPFAPEEGRKRKAELALASFDEFTFSYKANEKGQLPCRKDSGGPALRETLPKKWQIVGITAYSSAECNVRGASMRADAYASWIRSKVTN